MADRQDSSFDDVFARRFDRARLLKGAAATGALVGLGPLLAACGGNGGGSEGRTIKIGYVTPRTGPLAGFGTADTFVIEQMRTRFEDGLKIGRDTFPVEIVDRDSQSNSNRAATVAQNLILDDGVDLVLVAGTPDTTNPVADTCEANKVPCISTVAPWQPYFFGRNGNPEKGFKYTYHFFWGLEDIIAVFLDMWSQVDNNKVVGGLWPNDPDGNAWSDKKLGFPPPLTKAGYTVVDPGRFPDGNDDFSSQISKFKSENVQIVTGVPIPPDFTTFWTQALQQDFHPKIASIGKALLFPSAVEALGENGVGMSTEVWWSPNHPFTSSLTDQTAKELAAAFEDETDNQWTQPIGFAHALFEIAADALSRTEDVDKKEDIATAIGATSLDTVVGNVSWKGGPVPNVAKTKLVGGQWRKGTDYPYDIVIVSNKSLPDVPKQGSLEPIPFA